MNKYTVVTFDSENREVFRAHHGSWSGAFASFLAFTSPPFPLIPGEDYVHVSLMRGSLLVCEATLSTDDAGFVKLRWI